MDEQTEWLGDTDDPRRRPVVLQTGAADTEPRRRPVRYLAWAGTGLLGLVAAAGLVAGGTAVWSAFDPGTPGQSPAPLWFPPPATITPQSAKVTPTPTPDDHGGDRTRTPDSTRTLDDHGGQRTTSTKSSSSGSSASGTTEPGDDKGRNRGKSSGSSTDDKSGHR